MINRFFLRTLLATFILLSSYNMYSQSSLYIYRNDGQPTNTALLSQTKISFSGSNLLLFNRTSTSSIPISSVNKVLFSATNTKVNIEHAADNLMIFPNPVTDILHLKNLNDGPHTISIFSIDGKALITQQLSSEYPEVDVTNLPKGFYFFKANSQTVSFIKK